jgi:glycosyltransferase involved in cell wall biosynthesis
MLAGLPCIGTDAWAMPEIIEHGRTGWLVPDGATDMLAAALVRALSDPEECARLGSAGRARALELFTWDRVAARAIADIERVRTEKR